METLQFEAVGFLNVERTRIRYAHVGNSALRISLSIRVSQGVDRVQNYIFNINVATCHRAENKLNKTNVMNVTNGFFFTFHPELQQYDQLWFRVEAVFISLRL